MKHCVQLVLDCCSKETLLIIETGDALQIPEYLSFVRQNQNIWKDQISSFESKYFVFLHFIPIAVKWFPYFIGYYKDLIFLYWFDAESLEIYEYFKVIVIF